MIPRVHGSTFSIEGALARHTPVIITDALSRWNVMERWSPQSLGKILHHRRTTVNVSTERRFAFRPGDDPENAREFKSEEVDFGCAVRRILEEPRDRHTYLMQQSIPEHFPELIRELEVPEWIQSEGIKEVNLWFGRDTVTPLHFDYSNNFFAQTYGEKQFTLFSPRDTALLYPYPPSGAMSHASHVDVDRVDPVRHPLYANASATQCSLQPGDLLFLPAFWWHHVRAAGVAISVSFWWPPRLNQLMESPNASRLLLKLYAVDRLEKLRTLLLVPNGLSFRTAADLLLRKDRIWDACVLALAAFDEWVSRCCSLARTKRSAGCTLEQLAAELLGPCRLLAQNESLPTAQRTFITDVPRLASGAARCNEREMVRGDVQAFLETLSSLEEIMISSNIGTARLQGK